MTFSLDNLAAILRGRGLKVVETAGWKARGYAQQDLKAARGVLWHHTATNRNAFINSNAPTLNLCTSGRSDLPGPLANIVFGRDGTCYIVATGVANHAGTGSAQGVPTNQGNHYLIGIEMESSGVAPWDWTAEQLREAPKLGAALELAYLGGLRPEDRLQLGHLEYSDAGKIDPAGWPGGMAGLRTSINNQIAAWNRGTVATPTTSKDDSMSAADVTAIKNHINAVLLGPYAWDDGTHPKGVRGDILAAVNATPGKVWATPVTRGGKKVSALQDMASGRTASEKSVAEIAALRSALTQLAAAQGATIDYAKIGAEVTKALAEGVVKVDVTVAGAAQ